MRRTTIPWSSPRALTHALRARREGAGRSHGPYPPPTDPRSPPRATPLSCKRSLHPCTPLTLGRAPAFDATQPPRRNDAREVHAGRGRRGRTVRGDCPRSGGHHLGVVCLGAQYSRITRCLAPLQKIPTARARAAVLGLWRSSCRPSGLGRRGGPFPVAYMLHGRWSVAPVARWPQQAHATVPWVTPQLLAHAQPVQLARVFDGGPPPHGMAQYDSPAPSRRARPTRRVPRRPQAVRWSWHCCAPPRWARCRQRGESVTRVVLAEAARVSRWAAQRRPAAPSQRVAGLHERVRT